MIGRILRKRAPSGEEPVQGKGGGLSADAGLGKKRRPTGGCDWITPQRLQIFLQYVRNLALLDRRLTPDLYTLVTAAKQIAGDQFAVTLIETAKDYGYSCGRRRSPGDTSSHRMVSFGIGQAEFPDGSMVQMKNRLPGPPKLWRTLQLRPKPTPIKRRGWAQRWNPLRQCSWPPEDTRIESFNLHVREQAKALIGADLARTEKFTTSIKDGIDLRETLRHWHTHEIYVKEIPPARGVLKWWCFCSTRRPIRRSTPGRRPGLPSMRRSPRSAFLRRPSTRICRSRNRAVHLRRRHVSVSAEADPGHLERSPLAFATTLEERLLAGALLHSQERHVARGLPK